ncbi:MAG: hypothetical protein V7731_19570 [Amphritea sp.]
MKKTYLFALLVTVIFSTGCSINHPVADDYTQYLENNEGMNVLPKSEMAAEYTVDQATKNHRYEFRAATVGYAHLWIVEFGKILDATLKSTDVQLAFNGLSEG